MTKLLLPAMLLTLAATGPARAAEAPELIRVAYADLDLASPAGVRVLDQRLTRAIERACAGDAVAQVQQKVEQARCRREARDEISGQRARAVAVAESRRALIASARAD